MTTNQREDQLPDEGASYGAMLGYWMNVMGLSDGQLARLMGVDRSYPGKIRRGDKFPSPETADLIRKRLLETAEDPGWNGPHVLTVDERWRMDALLRESYDREHTARQRAKPLREPVQPREPDAREKLMEVLMEELKLLTEEDVARLSAEWEHNGTYSASGVPARPLDGEAVPPDIGEDTGAVSSSAADPLPEIPAPELPGAQELEERITMMGGDPSADEMVRALLDDVRLLAFGQVKLSAVTHLFRCSVRTDRGGHAMISMVPVFTRYEHLMTAVRLHPHWGAMPVIEAEGSALLAGLDPEEYLGINPWSGHEFLLPASRSRSLFRRKRIQLKATAPDGLS